MQVRHTRRECPILAGLLFFRLGWDEHETQSSRSVSRVFIEPAGCPTLAGFLFFRLGWDTRNSIVRAAFPALSSNWPGAPPSPGSCFSG